MAAWAVRQYWHEYGQWDRRNWFKNKCLPSPFFRKIKDLKDGKLSPNKKKIRSPTAQSPWTWSKKTWKTMYSIWYFWAFLAATSQHILGTVRYIFVAEEGPTTRFMQIPLGWWSRPVTKMYGKWREKKTLKQKRVEVFGCCKSILFGATCSEAKVIKLLNKWWKHVPDLGKLTYPTGGKRKPHLEKCRLVGDIVSWQEGTVLGPG